jgi:hypothetical protein
MMAAAGMTAAALGTAVGPGTAPIHVQRAAAVSVADETAPEVDHSTVTVRPASGTTEPSLSGVDRPVSAVPDSTATTSTNASTTTTVATTTTVPFRAAGVTLPAADPNDTVPVVPGPTTPTAATPPQRPPTAPATAVPTTQAPTAPPTTPATTASSAPPTTAAPAVRSYLLGSSAAGNVASQLVLPLLARAPLNSALPNLDTDRDSDPGRMLRKDSILSLLNTQNMQRFRLDPAGKVEINGSVSVTLFAAARRLDDESVQTQAALVDCVDGGLCSIFARQTINFEGDDHFRPRTFDFGRQTRTLAASHNLELWIVVTSGSDHDMWMAYDTVGFESALTITG